MLDLPIFDSYAWLEYTLIMEFTFVFFGIALLLLLLGWPLWLIIWAFRQKNKTGKFPWSKFVIIFILLFLLGGLIRNASSRFLDGFDQNYGAGTIGGTINGKNIDF